LNDVESKSRDEQRDEEGENVEVVWAESNEGEVEKGESAK
jgi:hypothetical protein